MIKNKKANNVTKLEREIKNIISNSPVNSDLKHAISARKWVLKLNPGADLALQIAALAHDIERGCQNESKQTTKVKEDFKNYIQLKKIHSQKSAEVIVDLLNKHEFDKSFIAKVKSLVLKHEFGGDKEADVLMDADSLSFFQENFIYYYKKYGEDKAKSKINFMYSRMSANAKKLARKINFKSKKLEKIFKEEINEKN